MELWRKVPVAGLGKYMVSNHGRVKGQKGQVMKSSVHRKGYRRIMLCEPSGARKRFFVHTLVLMAFRGMPGPGQQCRHLDGDTGNDKIENLKWGTAMENRADRIKHGKHNAGEKHGCNKLTNADVLKIRRLHSEGVSTWELGKRYPVHYSHIWKIVTRKAWTHI